VTARHIDFLFNREETVVSEQQPVRFSDSYVSPVTYRIPNAWRLPVDDTELQLPPSDESKVGDDV
jgi:hypothetical protein